MQSIVILKSLKAATKTSSWQFFLIHQTVLVLTLLNVCGCNRPVDSTVTLRGKTMGTTYSIKYLPGTGTPDSKAVHSLVDAELTKVNQQMSTYIPSSELSRFNNARSTEWFEVSAETANVVALALEVSELTGGAFDVTVGPLVNLWGFGATERRESEPSDEQIQTLLSQVGFRKLHVRTSPPALRKDVPELAIDLSAIAKGHGVDRVAKELAEVGISNYFVEIGGEVATRGFRADGKRWQVGIERPTELEQSLHSVVGLSGESMATSGDYRNYFVVSGKRFSHTIDAVTGRPVHHQLASASVIADNCALADALATGMMALGPERALELAERQHWTVMLIIRTDAGFQSISTTAYANFIATTSDPQGRATNFIP